MAKQSVIAFFFDRENADTAVLSLRLLAIPDDDVTISPAAAAQPGNGPEHVRKFWIVFENLFGSNRDRALYAEGIRRGYVMVVAQVQRTNVGSVAALLGRHGAADLDACDVTWRADGWTGGPAGSDARDQVGACPPSTEAVARQVEIDRGAASVLAAASAEGAYRFRSAEDVVLRGEAARGQDVDREDAANAATSAAGATAGSSEATELDHENGGPSRDGERLPERALSVQRAKGLEVVCSDGQHVGTIEEVEGTTMRVWSGEPASERTIRSIPTTWIHSIDDRVMLKISSADMRNRCVVG